MTGQRYVPARDMGATVLGGHWVKDGPWGERRSRDDSLDSLMEIDHVIRVDAEGLVHNDASGMYAPEFYAPVDGDGQYTADTEREIRDQVRSVGWEPEGGWSGQQGTKGDDYTMHDSEFIGGNLAEHILSTPGYWVVCEVRTDEDAEETDNHAGWAVMHHPEYVERTDLLSQVTRGRVVGNVGGSFTVEWEDGTKSTEDYAAKGERWRVAE